MPDISSPPERTEELVERLSEDLRFCRLPGNGPSSVLASIGDDLADAIAALQSLGYAEMEKALRGVEAWFAGYIANGGKRADEELAMVRTALRGDQEQGEG